VQSCPVDPQPSAVRDTTQSTQPQEELGQTSFLGKKAADFTDLQPDIQFLQLKRKKAFTTY